MALHTNVTVLEYSARDANGIRQLVHFTPSQDVRILGWSSDGDALCGIWRDKRVLRDACTGDWWIVGTIN